MKITENKFNPRNNQFNTIKEWSKTLKTPTDWWKNKEILKIASRSILEGSDRLIDLGRGEKLYNFQQTNGKLLAFSDDSIGSPVEITNQIYQFRIDKFLKYISDKNGFHDSNEKLSKDDYVIGYLPIGDKKIIWICSFGVEGFQKYKTKPYLEDLNEECDFILLSDCFGSPPNIKDDKLSYTPLPFNLQNFKVDFHKFIKKESGISSDEARNYLKDKVTFFIDTVSGKIYYKNNLCKIRKGKNEGSYTYKFFIALLKKPLEEHEMESFVEKEVGLSAQHPGQDLAVKGRRFKHTIKTELKKIAPDNDDINKLLPDSIKENRGNIKLHLSKKDIFFF